MSTAWRFLSIFISSMINNGVQVVPSRRRTLVTVSPSDEALAEQSLATSSGKDDDEEMEESLNDYNSGRAGAAEREEEQRASAVNPRSARPVLANVKQAIESDDDDKGGLEDISDGHVMGTDGEVETESLSEDNVDLESDGDQPMSIDVASSDSEGEDGAVDELLPFEDRLSDGDEMLDYTSRAVPWVEHGSADVNWYSNHRIIVKSGYRYDKPYRASGFGTLEPGQRGPLVAIEESKIAGKVVEHFLQRLPDGDHKCACCADQAIKSKDASKAMDHVRFWMCRCMPTVARSSSTKRLHEKLCPVRDDQLERRVLEAHRQNRSPYDPTFHVFDPAHAQYIKTKRKDKNVHNNPPA